MRIGLIAPPFVPVPPTAYGGTEAVVANLAVELQRLGHEVRLFTVGESTCAVDRAHLFARAVTPIGAGVEEAAHVLAAYEELDDVDIIHDHTILGPLISGRVGVTHRPVVVTHHGLFTPVTRHLFSEISKTAHVIAISREQARRAGEVPITAIIHHGIDIQTYSPGSEPLGDHLVFVGRMSPDKGVHTAVRIAHAAGRPLRIVTKMREEQENDYYRTMVEPLLAESDSEPVELPLTERIAVLRTAYGLLDPIAWPEPFGLVMAESLATGTPVVAAPLGAAPEIVTPGRTGFLPQAEELAVTAVGHLDMISRRTCREEAVARFSAERMTRDYLRVYWRILEDRGGGERTLASVGRAPRLSERQRLSARRIVQPEAPTTTSYRRSR